MIIVGIDASLTSTGIAVFDDAGIRTYAIQPQITGPERLIEIRNKISHEAKNADLVFLEGYAFARANQAHQMGELGGVLRVMFLEMGIKVIEVAPSTVKKFATGKGNAKKEDIAVAVYKRWKFEADTNDEIDAYCLLQIGLAYMNRVNGLTAFQREVIDGLKKEKKAKGKGKK
ncbi:MAG: crossover junction endodeoxyribonuclease RuvC [Dehalococcoidales bacterium]